MRNMILCGDVREQLRLIPDETVNCVVTSPPYWGLRDYGTASWEGGDNGCDHKNGMLASMKSTLNGGHLYGEHEKVHSNGMPFRDACGKCGAVRVDNQLGLERTPEEYVAHMVEVFREVRRVLRKDGTLWLNLGDSYAGSNGTGGNPGDKQYTNVGSRRLVPDWKSQIIKPKDLVGIPWRVAFALQADGWWLRSDIIWAKPNPMPESVTDRPTKAHEYIFLLTKSQTYWYDADAIKERAKDPEDDQRRIFQQHDGNKSVATVERAGLRVRSLHMEGTQRNDGERWRDYDGGVAPRGTRNARTVWEIATQPYSEAHFATYPEELVKRCIKAGCPEGGLVLDPFLGSGTTAMVAKNAGRDWIGIELNPAYVEMAKRRINVDQERLL